jgi:hypothetical protein
MTRISLFFLLICFLHSCKRAEPEISFYHWRSNYIADDRSEQLIRELKVKKIVVHTFDVDWSQERNMPELKARLKTESKFPQGVEIVPIVYLTRRVMANADPNMLLSLIIEQSEKCLGIARNQWKSFHWDCDWNAETREPFFRFLSLASKVLPTTEQVSTLRLSQIKYASKSGIPPVNRGVLMLYNVGEFRQYSEMNSILNYTSVEPYLSSIGGYPLPLDLALPVFQWGIHYRLGEVQGIISEPELESLLSDSMWKSQGDTLFQARSGFFQSGRYFKSGDVVKLESTSPIDCKSAAEWIRPHWKNTTFTLYFYHLNSPVVYAHSPESFRAVSAVFP